VWVLYSYSYTSVKYSYSYLYSKLLYSKHPCESMPSLVLIGPAVRPAVGNRQTDRHIAFYYVDYYIVVVVLTQN